MRDSPVSPRPGSLKNCRPRPPKSASDDNSSVNSTVTIPLAQLPRAVDLRAANIRAILPVVPHGSGVAVRRASITIRRLLAAVVNAAATQTMGGRRPLHYHPTCKHYYQSNHPPNRPASHRCVLQVVLEASWRQTRSDITPRIL